MVPHQEYTKPSPFFGLLRVVNLNEEEVGGVVLV